MSRTRKKIEVFCASVLPARVLETNLYAVATPDKKSMERRPEYLDDSILCLLLRRLKPRVVISHGVAARQGLSPLLCSEGLSPDLAVHGSVPAEFTKVRIGKLDEFTHFKALKHLGGYAESAYGYQWMGALGSHVRELLSS